MIFGREPAAWVAALRAILWLVAGFTGWLDEQLIVLILAAVGALLDGIVMYKTDQTQLGWVLTVVQATVALAVGLGWNLDPALQGSIVAAVAAVISLWQRTQVVPLSKGSFALAA